MSDVDTKINDEIKHLLAANKTVRRTSRRMVALRRMREKKARPKNRSPKSTHGPVPPSAAASPDSYVQQVPLLSRATRFAILLSEREKLESKRN
jgi:hypothetical protein